MITIDPRAALNLAAAAEHVPRQAHAAAPAPGSVPRARPKPLPMPGGGWLLRMLPTARRPAPAARSTRSRRPPSPGYAQRASATKTSAQKPPARKTSAKDPLAFLHDPSLSIEDKLIQLLGYLNAKWDKQIQDKMDRIGSSETAKKASGAKPSGSSGSSGSKKKSGGFLGSLGGIGDFIQAVVSPATAALKIPAVTDVLKQVGGPVLAAGATALGAPELAPFLLKNAPQIVDAASKLASSLGGAEPGSGSGSSGSSGSKPSGGSSKPSGSGDGKALTDSETQMIFMQIQRIQQKQQEMFGVVSAILKSNHDTRMAVVNNIR
jgi:hypothetical protein